MIMIDFNKLRETTIIQIPLPPMERNNLIYIKKRLEEIQEILAEYKEEVVLF